MEDLKFTAIVLIFAVVIFSVVFFGFVFLTM